MFNVEKNDVTHVYMCTNMNSDSDSEFQLQLAFLGMDTVLMYISNVHYAIEGVSDYQLNYKAIFNILLYYSYYYNEFPFQKFGYINLPIEGNSEWHINI